ncbi:hypothetical protein TSAR_001793 [Trichomalopsis sarcophagae]|uniref:Uncharacterized protein n=1 Tax=Trichomalopsis sarcophagae TaxID=543379 RepID=A0A232EHG9_9HYME|nr:hypothetical protein TSAR_001793 [Trichomalopsis sarcophagae]
MFEKYHSDDFMIEAISRMQLINRSVDFNGRTAWFLSFIEKPMLPGYSGMFFAKDSPYVPRFNKVMRHCFKGGFINK